MTWEKQLLARFLAAGYAVGPRRLSAEERKSWRVTSYKVGYTIYVGRKAMHALATDTCLWVGRGPLFGDRSTLPGEMAFWRHEADEVAIPTPLDMLLGR